MKKQLWILGGGEVFENREKYLAWLEENFGEQGTPGSWKNWISDGLLDTHKTTRIHFPDTLNADYDAWKIAFEKHFDSLDNQEEFSIIAHSLGGIFIAKYLCENNFIQKIDALHLVAPVWSHPESAIHYTGNFSFDPEKLKNLSKNCGKVTIWASKDDEIVNFEDSEKYHEVIKGSTLRTFSDRGHFLGAHFIELFKTFL